MKKIILAFIPVLHEGYVRFIKRHYDACCLYILGRGLIKANKILAKEIRALSPPMMRKAITALNIVERVALFEEKDIRKIQRQKWITIVMPNEDISRELAELHFREHKIIYDNIFLRWDSENSLAGQEVESKIEISVDEFDKMIMAAVTEESAKSSDWWRQVGAIVLRGKKIILKSHNAHMPSPHTPYADGDPRTNFKKGLLTEISTGLHAERGLIAKAARDGIPLLGTSMYVSTFPCPACAKMIVSAGISTLYFQDGYAVMDGERVLATGGVKIFQIK